MPSPWHEHLDMLPVPPHHDPDGRIVVLSAHPDDEVLAIGGWLADRASRDITFVTATDGEASHPGSPSITPDELRAQRPDELLDALRALGFSAPEVRRLGLPDGGLAHEHVALESAIAPLVAGAGLVLAPFDEDGHPDHDALGAVAVTLCGNHIPLWQFPIWTWSWTAPHEQHWLHRIRRLDCSPEARTRKLDAIAAFTTQVRPLSDHPADLAVVDAALLDHASHSPEAIVT